MSRICAFFLFLLAASPAQGFPASGPGGVVVEAWTMEDGLPQNAITALAQTPDGYLWLGTLGGLARFDGHRFEVFDRAGTNGLESNRIQALHVDGQGRLWIGTEEGGLSVLENNQFTHFDQAHGLPSRTVLALAEDRDGVLWAGTEGGGLARLDGNRFTRIEGLNSRIVHALHADHQGRLWIGTEEGGLSVLENNQFTHFDQAHGLPSRTVLALAEDRDGVLWAGTEGGGLARLDGTRFVSVGSREGFPVASARYVSSLVADPRGGLWAGSFQGVARFDESRFTFYTTRQGLSRNQVNVLFRDREGSLWIGTDRGLNRLKETPFQVYAGSEGLADDAATAVYEDPSGVLWTGTHCGGLSRLENGGFRTYDVGDGLSNGCIWSITGDRTGALWIGTRSGLNRFENERFTTYTTANGLLDDFVRVVYEDPSGVLWVGTRSGLNRFANGRFQSYTVRDGLAHNQIRGLLMDRTGTLWIATAGGVSLLRNGQFQTYTTRNGLSSDDVRALYEDRAGVVWIGTYDGGLNRFKDGRFTAYTTQDGLADDRISVILEDAHGNLWMGGNRGVQRVGKEALHQFAAGEVDRVGATLFGKSDGLRNPECSGGFQPAGWKARDGRLWFPTLEGVAVVDPSQLLGASAPPPVLIGQVLADGEPVQSGHEAAPPPGDRNVEIRYTSTSLSSPGRIRFRFRLEGFDETWVEAGTRRTAYYRHLPPGRYRFRVTASNDGVTWNETGASLALYVAPYFYERLWFLWLGVLGLLAALGAGYRFKTRSLMGQAEQLQHLVETRTGALLAEKERAEAALQEAEAQREIAQQALSIVEDQATQLLWMDHLKSRFFANISHEFRTPLTLVFDPLESALRGAFGPLDPGFKGKIGTALRNARRLLHLINQLLDLAKLEAGSMELRASRSDVIPFLRSIIQVFHPEAERLGLALYFAPEPARLELYFERDKLEKIVFNLISNAFKATPTGGKIWISVREIESDTDEAGFAELVVRDTGSGIPPEKLPYIFDRFYQATDAGPAAYRGTGIGLALVRELVEVHRGSVRVESLPGFGSAFTVLLPLGRGHLADHEIAPPDAGPHPLLQAEFLDGELPEEPGAAAPEPAEIVAGPGGDGAAPLVLVVEDNPDVRELLRGHLATDYRVVEAQDGRDGLDKARRLRPDLIVSDVLMPEMSGVTLCRMLKQDERLRDVPVILLTARASAESRLEGLETGADDYVTKPFDILELQTRIGNLIRTRRALRDQFSQELVLRPSGIVVPSAEAVFLEQVYAVVDAHLEEGEFTVETFASELGMSQAQLKRRLRALVDQAPVELIRNRRLQRATELLDQRTGTISEIAFQVGFTNVSYFTKCFRERYGVPPSGYNG